MPAISIGAIVVHLQSAVACGHCQRWIEREQHLHHTNVTTPSIHGFAGKNVSPYEKLASPERDKPRSLRKDDFAGTGAAAFLTGRFRFQALP